MFGSEAKLADMSGAEAVSAATGFVQSCASSFYTTDSGTYWNFSPISAGLCTVASTSPFSDLPDGALVEKGAVSEVIRRGAGSNTFAEHLSRRVNTIRCGDTLSDKPIWGC